MGTKKSKQASTAYLSSYKHQGLDDSIIFEDWFVNCFIPVVKHYLKIGLSTVSYP